MIWRGDWVRKWNYPHPDAIVYEVDEVLEIASGHGDKGEVYVVRLKQLTPNPQPEVEE